MHKVALDHNAVIGYSRVCLHMLSLHYLPEQSTYLMNVRICFVVLVKYHQQLKTGNIKTKYSTQCVTGSLFIVAENLHP